MVKKIISSVVLIVFLFCGMVSSRTYAENPLNSTSRIEGVLVFDVSNSMLTSDPSKISNEAMKMFIDMSSIKGDKIGAIAYADEVIREKALVAIRSEQDKKDLKDYIDSVGRYPFTDISAGVKEAVKVLDASHEKGYSPLIVLLADGNNDVNETKGKTVTKADEDLSAAVADAKAKGYPIYTIGLNADGKLNKDVLNNIAASTKGKFFETSTADALPRILSEIFADHLKLKIVPVDSLIANGEFQDIKINVPNQNVLEANISLISSQPVEVKLVDPTGAERAVPSENIVLSRSNTYSMIKLTKPSQGDWTLKVKGIPQDKIDINLVFNYDLQLKLAPLANKSFKKGDKVKIESFFEDNGQQIANQQLYQSMKATLSVKDLDKNKTEEIPLSAGEKGFTGQFTLGDSNNYEVTVKAEDNSFYRVTEPQKISIQKAASAANSSTPPKPEKEDSFPWLYVGLAALIALVAGLVLFLRLNNNKRGFSGQMVIEVRNEDTGERSNPQFKKLNQFTGKIQLHQLLSLAPEFAETAQITFKPNKGDTLLLINLSNCTIEKGGRAIDAKKGQEVRRGDRLRIALKQTNKSIYIEYIS